MNATAIALSLALAAALNAGATESAPAPKAALLLKPKAAIANLAPHHTYAPFIAPSSEPELDLLPRRDARLEASRSSCSGDRSLCYDPGSGRIVYKPARAFMPGIPGLRAENISLKRDRITLRYSF